MKFFLGPSYSSAKTDLSNVKEIVTEGGKKVLKIKTNTFIFLYLIYSF